MACGRSFCISGSGFSLHKEADTSPADGLGTIYGLVQVSGMWVLLLYKHCISDVCSAIIHRHFCQRGLKYHKGIVLDLCHETCPCHSFPFFIFRNCCVILTVCFGSLSCLNVLSLRRRNWDSTCQPAFWYIQQAFMMPSVNVIAPAPFVLMLPHFIILPPTLSGLCIYWSAGQSDSKQDGS